MKHIFISHAGRDSGIAKRLCEDLRNIGHEVMVDLNELKLGDDTIQFMNDAIAQAHTNIILFSGNTPDAKWQNLEINAAVWNEAAQKGGKVIVLKLDDTLLPPLLGPKMFGSLDAPSYMGTFERLAAEIIPQTSDTSLVCEALKEGSSNPFWRVRAEYFEAMPALLANAFSPPDAAKIGILEEMMPCFLEGSRGTGKTMLLLSLRARILASRPTPTRTLQQLFGFYVRLDRGAYCNSGIRLANEGEFDRLDPQLLMQLADTFSQEFYLTLLESLLSELAFCAKAGTPSIDAATESALARDISMALSGPNSSLPAHFDALLWHCYQMHRLLSDFVRRKFIHGEQATVPSPSFDLTLFKRVVTLIRTAVPFLGKSQFTVLLDEYENLFSYQKVIVNSLIKLGPPHFSVKVARKVGTEETSRTTLGQELQEGHDYNRIPLIYSVEDDADFARYLDLLEQIVSRLLRNQNLPAATLASILPPDNSDEVDPQELQDEILKLAKLTPTTLKKLSVGEQLEKATYYREAAVYRLLYGRRGRRTEKRFAGHKELAFLSSGVIRYFQEILGMAYHLQTSSAIPSPLSISPDNQSRAVHTVSNHNLATLSRNVETYGEQLKYFLLDLGDCLRHKLLHHSSEPEAGRLAIKDPELLKTGNYTALDEFLNLGVREGVFQTVSGRPGMRPKHVDDPQPVEFNIARIFAPALQFSPRLRWTSPVSCAELLGLYDPERRRTTKGKLLKRLVKIERPTRQKKFLT
jgi:hypothetical protein